MVYILHFEEPYYHARHYVGYTEDTGRRFKEHFNCHSSGSPLIQAALEAGIKITVSRIYFDGGRELERKIKKSHHTHRFCPICKEEAA